MGDVKVTLTGDEAKLMRSIQKVIDKQVELATATGKTGEASERAAHRTSAAHEKAFGHEALAMVTKFSVGFLSIEKAVEAVGKAFEDFKERGEQAVKRIDEALSKSRALAQVSASGKDFGEMQKSADQLRIDFGMKKGDSLDLVRAATSRGITGKDDLRAFAQLGEIGIDPASGINAVENISSAFGGEAGSPREILNKLLAAAPGKFGEMTNAVGATGIPMHALGIKPDEVLSMLAQLAEETKSPEKAGSKLAALATFLNENRKQIRFKDGQDVFAERGMLAGLAEMQLGNARMGKGVKFDKFMPAGVQLTARELIEHYERSRKIRGDIRGQSGLGEGADFLTEHARMIESDPALAASAMRERNEARKETAGERKAGGPAELRKLLEEQMMMQTQRSLNRTMGDSPLSRFFGGAIGKSFDLVHSATSDTEFLRNNKEFAGKDTGALIEQYLQSIDNGIKKLGEKDGPRFRRVEGMPTPFSDAARRSDSPTLPDPDVARPKGRDR